MTTGENGDYEVGAQRSCCRSLLLPEPTMSQLKQVWPSEGGHKVRAACDLRAVGAGRSCKEQLSGVCTSARGQHKPSDRDDAVLLTSAQPTFFPWLRTCSRELILRRDDSEMQVFADPLQCQVAH